MASAQQADPGGFEASSQSAAEVRSAVTLQHGSSSRHDLNRMITLTRVAIVGLVTLIYGQTLKFDLVDYDDPLYVNSIVLGGLNAQGIRYAFSTFDTGNWIPLTWLSLELDATLFGGAAWGFHFTNLLLHAINGLLLFDVLRRMTGTIGRSAFVALLFVVHPLRVESVAWVSERKDVLSTAMLLVTMSLYERYARRPSWQGLMFVLSTFVMGLMAKPMLVTVPILLLLLDAWPLGRRLDPNHPTQSPPVKYPTCTPATLLLEKLPFVLAAVGDSLITIRAQRFSGALGDSNSFPWSDRILNAVYSYGCYLATTLLPTGLSPAYEHASSTGESLTIPATLSGVALLTITVVAISKRKCPALLMGWLWFLISLLPVIGLIQVGAQSRADRYTYIPHIGLFVAIVWGIDAWSRQQVWRTRLMPVLGIIVVTVYAACSYQLTGNWRDAYSLWNRVAVTEPEGVIWRLGMTQLLLKDGQLENAEEMARETLARSPTHRLGIYMLGMIVLKNGHGDQAVQCYQWLSRTHPNTHLRMELLRAISQSPPATPPTSQSDETQDRRQAKADVADANEDVRVPEAVTAMGVGRELAYFGRFSEAINQFQTAVRLDPKYGGAHTNLGIVYLETGDLAQAREHLETAVELRKNDWLCHFNLARLYRETKELNLEIRELEEAVRLNPRNLEARTLLDRAHYLQSKDRAAIARRKR